MKSIVIITKLFNILTIGITQACILFVTGLFFLGSQENSNDLLEKLPEAFFSRFVAGAIIGIFGCIIMVVGNLLLNRFKPPNEKVRILRIVIFTFLLSIVTSLAGTSFFFFH
jgi:drug/metabolite transporter (DMT)-like permease